MTTTTAPTPQPDIRPVVRTAAPSRVGVWLFAGALALGGLLLFQALDARRQALVAPTTLPGGTGGGMIAAPPPLALPGGFYEAYPEPGPLARAVRLPVAGPVAPTRLPPTRFVERPAVLSPDDLATLRSQQAPPYVEPLPAPQGPVAPALADPGERVTAGRLANPSLTVPQGSIIAAVLETALDSSRPGAARAIISRDVRSFDGSRVLIPRGSRLYGEYASDVSAGQNRALVTWQRLTRPDAVVIQLDSPSADPLGRAGIRGKVDSHFFARFGSAILQSVLDIGVGLATRSVIDDGDSVILALPGSTQQLTQPLTQGQSQVQPTLRVRQGTSVSVFVRRDLDFSTVDR